MQPIVFDLKTMLPTIREAFDKGQLQAQDPNNMGRNCKYNGPCAIGVCIPPERRSHFDDGLETSVEAWLDGGEFSLVHESQRNDLTLLQAKHDRCMSVATYNHTERVEEFEQFLTKLEGKYL